MKHRAQTCKYEIYSIDVAENNVHIETYMTISNKESKGVVKNRILRSVQALRFQYLKTRILTLVWSKVLLKSENQVFTLNNN